ALKAARAYAKAPGAYLDQGRDVLVNRADAAALLPVIEGRVPLLVHVERASDMRALIALKQENPTLKMVFVGASEGWMIANELAAAKIPVLASALNDLPESFEMLAATQSNVGRMKAAGVVVGLGIINDNDARQARYEKQYAGNLVALTKVPGASGLGWDAAFASITGGAAEAIGLGGEFGTLKPGRRGDVVIWSGDPLELDSVAESVYIDGVKQSLSTRQGELLKRYRQPQEGALPKAYER
ncbi:MAG: amidohydrolase, partial [Sphingomonas sp.]|nr:amidohydrolase [Sphingomonas sp.]